MARLVELFFFLARLVELFSQFFFLARLVELFSQFFFHAWKKKVARLVEIGFFLATLVETPGTREALGCMSGRQMQARENYP